MKMDPAHSEPAAQTSTSEIPEDASKKEAKQGIAEGSKESNPKKA